jgi:hypothetical protein
MSSKRARKVEFTISFSLPVRNACRSWMLYRTTDLRGLDHMHTAEQPAPAVKPHDCKIPPWWGGAAFQVYTKSLIISILF